MTTYWIIYVFTRIRIHYSKNLFNWLVLRFFRIITKIIKFLLNSSNNFFSGNPAQKKLYATLF